MNTTARTSLWIVSLFVLPSFAVAKPYSHPCAAPTFVQLVGQDIAGADPVKFFPVANSHDALRWAFASSEGPPDGMTFIVKCDGKPIASIETGFFENVRSGPIVNHRDTVELSVVPDSGTGISDHSVLLLQFDGRKILQLWTHVSDDKWYEPLESRIEEGEIAYNWQYENAGTKIIVHGKDTESTIERGRPTTAPTKKTFEVFCLRGAAFKKCRW